MMMTSGAFKPDPGVPLLILRAHVVVDPVADFGSFNAQSTAATSIHCSAIQIAKIKSRAIDRPVAEGSFIYIAYRVFGTSVGAPAKHKKIGFSHE